MDDHKLKRLLEVATSKNTANQKTKPTLMVLRHCLGTNNVPSEGFGKSYTSNSSWPTTVLSNITSLQKAMLQA